MATSKPTAAPLLRLLAVDDHSVRRLVKALSPTPEWRLAMMEYARRTRFGARSHDELEATERAPVLKLLLAAVTTHVGFGGKASLADLAQVGCPQVLLQVLELQVKKVAEKKAAAASAR